MNRQTFIWGRFTTKLRQEEYWTDFVCLVGLFLAALMLYSLNLGSLPLRDWDEGTLAQVAKEIWQAPSHSLRWLFPTLWGEPYLNKPPLVHDLMALVYHFGGASEWTARLPGALLTAFSVPLLYLLGREVFPSRWPALFSALIYLTLFPVVRHGRLAMLDGAVLCFQMVMVISVLRSRRDLRWSLGAGLGFSLICLTKGILGVLLGGVVFVFLAWDTPRLLTSAYFWFGWFLGSTPALAWYGAQWLHYEHQFTQSILAQQVSRVAQTLDHHYQPPWFYVGEIFKYSWPWLLFSLWGWCLAWQERVYSWSKLVLVWSGAYLVAVSVMGTKLPWYVMPIYPALALSGGAILARLQDQPRDRPYPVLWLWVMGLMAVGATGAGLGFYLGVFTLPYGSAHPYLVLTLLALALTMGVTTLLMVKRSGEFIGVLFWGMYVSLLLFVSSPFWIWELNEAFPVKPVAQLIQGQELPPHEPIYTPSLTYERPSLNFYSARRVIPISFDELMQRWQKDEGRYFLVDDDTWNQFNKRPEFQSSGQQLGKVAHFYLIRNGESKVKSQKSKVKS